MALGPVEWMIGATGAALLVAAVMDESPMGIIREAFTGSGRAPITRPSETIGRATAGAVAGAVAPQSLAGAPVAARNIGPGSTQKGSGLIASRRAQEIQARRLAPILAPIPWQPSLKMDYEAVASLVRVYMAYGRPLPATGTMRSKAVADAGNASQPGRFASGDTSAHVVGLAIDFDANKVDLDDPRFVSLMVQNGWFRVGRSGPMHWSYGIPA